MAKHNISIEKIPDFSEFNCGDVLVIKGKELASVHDVLQRSWWVQMQYHASINNFTLCRSYDAKNGVHEVTINPLERE